jgi:hypothetical protein
VMAGCSKDEYILTLPDVDRTQMQPVSAELIVDRSGAGDVIITLREPSGHLGRIRHSVPAAQTRNLRSNREFYLKLSDGEKLTIPLTVTDGPR